MQRVTGAFKYISELNKSNSNAKKTQIPLHRPLYRNSLVLIFNSAFSPFFALLFWIVAARTMPAKDIGLVTASISAAALIMGLSKLGLDAGLIRYS
jgi:O-antigen/teichoic acid export membrane protein